MCIQRDWEGGRSPRQRLQHWAWAAGYSVGLVGSGGKEGDIEHMDGKNTEQESASDGRLPGLCFMEGWEAKSRTSSAVSHLELWARGSSSKLQMDVWWPTGFPPVRSSAPTGPSSTSLVSRKANQIQIFSGTVTLLFTATLLLIYLSSAQFPRREASMKLSGGLIQENFFYSCILCSQAQFPPDVGLFNL